MKSVINHIAYFAIGVVQECLLNGFIIFSTIIFSSTSLHYTHKNIRKTNNFRPRNKHIMKKGLMEIKELCSLAKTVYY